MIEKRTIIWCDAPHCGQGHHILGRRHEGSTAQEVRKDGFKRGWIYVSGVIGEYTSAPPGDFCPRHNPKES